MRIWLLVLVAALIASPAAAQETGMTVAMDVLATAIENRSPVAATAPVPATVGQLFYFTEVHGGPGKIEHVWIWRGRTIATVPLEVRSPRYRTWSSKRIQPDWTGQWRVEARTADGKVLSFKEFVVE
jgi:hypothetical protein